MTKELVVSEEKVRELMESCPEWKTGLMKLFGDQMVDEEKEDNKKLISDFWSNPAKYLSFEDDDRIIIDRRLLLAYETLGHRIPNGIHPCVTLDMLVDLLTRMNNSYKKIMYDDE